MGKSLSEIHSSVKIKSQSHFFLRLLTFTGPAFMVSVGYMDPGNWATDLAGGAKFGYQLIWVILVANLMAILFQTLSARLGIVYGRDLAQACSDHYPKPINYFLWLISEVAIAATDLAEVLGSAIGLYILFKIPLVVGVVITTFDVLILMGLMSFGIRKMEAFILSLIATIGICFAIEMIISKPELGQIAIGFIPTSMNTEALFVALGIIGATVMPHNLYLHSALVQSRYVERTNKGLKEANKFNLIDSVVALNAAFFVNAAILVLAAAVFFSTGHSEIASIIGAHALLTPLLGSTIAPIVFGVALLAAGQSSTITGTFAGQIVMEGFIGLKLRPWLRRLITRLIAIIPAVLVIRISGQGAVDSLLVLSQVILSLQLPFALVPLLHFTSNKEKMKEFVSNYWIKFLAWLAAVFIVVLNFNYLFDLIKQNISSPSITGILVRYILIPISFVLLPLLFWITFEPYLKKEKISKILQKAPGLIMKTKSVKTANDLSGKTENYKKVGMALEGNLNRDEQILTGAMSLLKSMNADVFLIHCVESVAGRFMGDMVADSAAQEMNEYLKSFAEKLSDEEIPSHIIIGGGEPRDEIVRIAHKYNLELIIAGSHGHKFIDDLIYGATLDNVRHRVKLPVLAIPVNK
ncbi:MAG: Nramp family divalent metal transporter [Bacteroidetes bacterium]|nr:Nramp family divalent metal transporter [Bacteroidota bacterium]